MKALVSRRPLPTAALIGVACGLMAAGPGCHRATPEPVARAANTSAARQSDAAPSADRAPRAQLVADRQAENPLNTQRAFGYLRQLCELGPRPSGSGAMARQQAMLTRYFEQLGGRVSSQEFFIEHPLTGEPVRCANLIVEWHPESEDRVLLCAHYDTRPLPDQDPDPRRRREGVFVGANDGASGVAALMELARHLADSPMSVGVDFVLFDAEELVYRNNRGNDVGEYFLGSTHFAHDYRNNRPPHRYHWGVLLDMVGDAELRIMQEKFSMSWPDTRPLVMDLWRTARRLGVDEFVPRTKRGAEFGFVQDDHIPLRNIARIPTCNIIDTDYPDIHFGQPGSYWHTEQDVPENCSGESLVKVGWVVLEWLRGVEVP